MKDIYLDSTNKDLVVENYDLKLTSNLTEYLSIKIEIVLSTFFGEWWLDNTIGVTWNQDILIKNPNIGLVNTIIKDAVLDIEEVKEIISFESIYDTQLRAVNIDMAVLGIDGEIVEVSL